LKNIEELPESIKEKVRADPYYFVYEGGSDGTFPHEVFFDDYGEYYPAISNYAGNLLEEQGLTW